MMYGRQENDVVYIYGLIDPRDGKIYYIGQTDNPRKRLISHIKDNADSSSEKSKWILSLKSDGVVPNMKILDQCDGIDADYSEQSWINMGYKQGWPLTNQIGLPGELPLTIGTVLNASDIIANTKRGRPKSNRPIWKFTVTAMFDEEYDADLVEIIKNAPDGKKWATMKMLMRLSIQVGNGATTDDDEDE